MYEITVFVKFVPPDMEYQIYSKGLSGIGKTTDKGAVVKTISKKIHIVPWENIMLITFGAKTDETFEVPGEEGISWSSSAEWMNSQLGPR